MRLERVIAVALAISLFVSVASADDKQQPSIIDSIGGWFSQAWKDSSEWVSHAWEDSSAWVVQAWDDVSAWTAQAWDDSSKWVSQAWADTSEWASVNWDSFIVWVNIIASGDPYSWIKDVVLDNGVLAYDAYAEMRSFINEKPNADQLHQKYNEIFSKLSLLDQDKEKLWETLDEWSTKKGLTIELSSQLALPFLLRLVIEGESVIDENAVFSGPVVGQYMLTILDAMNLDSTGTAEMRLKILIASLDGLTRPVIIGDSDQNQLVTEDQYYIENFTYLDGKYQIIMIASLKKDQSKYPLLNGKSIDATVEQYFKSSECNETETIMFSEDIPGESVAFSFVLDDKPMSGKLTALWSQKYLYQFFIITDQEWSNDEYKEWFGSIAVKDANSVSLAVDLESDGSFFGVNQSSQKYTINRIFDEEKFTVPMTGHGWAAERGNNLVDNLKGIFKGQHSTVVGDNNYRNGADRITYYADGSRVLIQTKYYSSASRSLAACFDETGFRYIDHLEGKPMAIEVPSDQYEAVLEYMKNHIANGEFREYGYEVTDVDRAVEIVKEGNLTYQQAKHIAKAGTIESIKYDAVHSCITAVTAMGLSAAVSFAVNLWNGESAETALKESVLQGLKTGGTAFIISVLSSQIAKTSLNSAMIPASKVIVHALGPKVSAVIVNAFRPAGSAIYGAAAMQSAAKLLRGNVITSAVTFVVLSAGDVADIIQGRISWKQLAKNVSTTAVGITGGLLGYLGGAALGTAILPGAGTVVGIIVSVAAGWGASEGGKALADLIAEDDADEMIRLIEEQFSEIATEYFLNEDEVNQSIANLQGVLTPEMLKQMYQYRNHNAFARQLIEMAIDPVVAQRAFVSLPTEEEYSEYLTQTLEAIYEDVSGETVTE